MSIKPPVGRARAAAGPGDPSREARVAKAAVTACPKKCAAASTFSRGSFSELWRSCEATACEQPVGRRHGRHVRPLRTRVRPEGRLWGEAEGRPKSGGFLLLTFAGDPA